MPPRTTTSEETRDDVQVGDAAEVVSGPHCGYLGTVETICSSMVCLRPYLPGYALTVDVKLAKFLPPPNSLRYSPEQGYNVRSGDVVEVVRGRWIGRRGIVGAIDLQKKILEVNAWAGFVSACLRFHSLINFIIRIVSSFQSHMLHMNPGCLNVTRLSDT